MIESTVSLSYVERMKAEMAVVSGRPLAVLWLCFLPLCGILILSLPPLRLPDFLVAGFCFAYAPAKLLLTARRGQKNAVLLGPFVYRLSPDGFELRSRTAEFKQSWAGIPRLRIGFGFLLIYANKKCAYPLPLRLLSAAQTESVFLWAKAAGVERVGA